MLGMQVSIYNRTPSSLQKNCRIFEVSKGSTFDRNYILWTMNMKNNSMTIFITILFMLQNIYLCDTDVSDSSSEVHPILKNVIPDCVFGVKTVSYFLYTRNERLGKEVHMNDDHIPMRVNKTVVFLIHGFISEANNSNYFDLITVWLRKEDINIFSLDWSNAACRGSIGLADLLTYKSAVKNVPTVGRYLSNFVVKLVKEYGVKVNKILVVGHSLGAHLAGYSGKIIQEMVHQKYKQIIGLDAAGPDYENKDCTERLCKSDAAFVQAYHTSYLAGIHKPIGDADFYFNGGLAQPGCIFSSCSHSRAVLYLTMTIQYPPCFIGTPWNVGSEHIFYWKQCNPKICSFPGLNISEQTSKGTYYVTTACEAPYCTL